MRRSLRCALLALAVWFVGARGEAIPTSELLARSRAAAGRGDFNASARALEELVAAGVDDETVLYDLGTVYARAGRFGEAIHRFEQVVDRRVFDGDAQHNLRAARLRLAHRDAERSGRAVAEAALPLRVALGEILPLDASVLLAVLSQLALGASLWIARRRGEGARIAGLVGASAFVLTTMFAWSVVGARVAAEPAGIVLRDGVRLLGAPAEDAIASEAVREGERVTWIDRTGTFARVRTTGGRQGWIRLRDVGAL
jgi:hypothetical protein